MDVYVRSIDQDLWRQLKAAAALRGMSIGALLNEILRQWLTAR